MNWTPTRCASLRVLVAYCFVHIPRIRFRKYFATVVNQVSQVGHTGLIGGSVPLFDESLIIDQYCHPLPTVNELFYLLIEITKVQLMKNMKKLLDPKGILNPYNVLA
ncbi:hypothetical protein SELMODRAFT_421550 [Selaginella moellendorffii]|nr:hypothetical protein SELMODRAFT_421550 [Selaginella moellendorffii]